MTLGTLFTEDFLAEGVLASPAWAAISGDQVAGFAMAVRAILSSVATPDRLNEAQTEERIVRKVLAELGWGGLFDVQVTVATRGRANVPDYSLFPTPEAFAKADASATADGKLKHAIAVGDAKAWSIGLDQRNSGAGANETPAAQILRYLGRAEILSDRSIQWGLLTNGRTWRLYYAGARSPLDGYFEADLAWLVEQPGTQGQLDQAGLSPTTGGETDAERRDRLLKTFMLVFRRQSFVADAALGGKTFHHHALDQGRLWETKVRTDLSDVVFQKVFPGLVRALAAADLVARPLSDPAYLAELRDAAMTLLYRLLFALYAEDRDLLPPSDLAYDNYSLSRIRDDIASRLDRADRLSARSTAYFDHCATLFGIIDEGDASIGIPPYNGGLFAKTRAVLLDRARLGDAVFAPLLDLLSRTQKDGRLVRINFRDLSVRELGAIYEGLLEYEPVADAEADGGISVRPNPFSRKNSGSYYTPDELVTLIVERTVKPLIDERTEAFRAAAKTLADEPRPLTERLQALARHDPAEAILDLKICDPAMGSGHFLVSLIDYLAVKVFTATGEAANAVEWAKGQYASPVLARIAMIRERIKAEAVSNNWQVRDAQLSDQNLIKRMVLKRCIYGVDKNPMAVELAKVALWLHTFTAGAPLSFLDHHLRCGDSLFGERVRKALDELAKRGTVLISEAIRRAEAGVVGMEQIERITDAEVAEVKASRAAFDDVEKVTRPLARFLDFWQAVKWLALDDDEKRALTALLDGRFGDPVEVAARLVAPLAPDGADAPSLFGDATPSQMTLDGTGVASIRDYHAIRRLLDRAHALAGEEHFLHWEVAFPGVWRNWQNAEPDGGFDAVIGNPPWDRMKMQEVEWFAARAPMIAKQARAADRKAAIAKLSKDGDSLAQAYDLAAGRAEMAMARARKSGDYPLLSKGDINLYSLFVERAQAMIGPKGIAGLLTPSGIASDLTASVFFKSVASSGRIACIFDFENRGVYFPDVHRSFKFCTFVVGGRERHFDSTLCGFFLSGPPAADDEDNLFRMTAGDFVLVNPNTGTAPIFRTKRDAALTTAIYRRLPVLVDRSTGIEVKTWPVKYLTMFHMTNDSHLFCTRDRLEAEGAYPIGRGRWRKGDQEWVPLFVGRMVHHFDHRASSVTVNEENIHNAALSVGTTETDHADPNFVSEPQYWVTTADLPPSAHYAFGFRDIARSTDERTAIGTIVPNLAAGNTLPLVIGLEQTDLAYLSANFAALALDYFARQKAQGT